MRYRGNSTSIYLIMTSRAVLWGELGEILSWVFRLSAKAKAGRGGAGRVDGAKGVARRSPSGSGYPVTDHNRMAIFHCGLWLLCTELVLWICGRLRDPAERGTDQTTYRSASLGCTPTDMAWWHGPWIGPALNALQHSHAPCWSPRVAGGGDSQRWHKAELLRQAGGDRVRRRRQLPAAAAAVRHRTPRGAAAGIHSS